jgi:hypothetical protein
LWEERRIVELQTRGTYFDHWDLDVYILVRKSRQLITCRDNSCFLSDPNKTHKYTVWGERGKLKTYTGGTYSDHWALAL